MKSLFKALILLVSIPTLVFAAQPKADKIRIDDIGDYYTSTEVEGALQEIGGGGAPTDADYLVGTANASLSAEIVVGTTPGGELGGTWGSPTVDSGIHDDEYIELEDIFVGDVTGTYDATIVGNDSHTHGAGTITEADPLALLTAGTDNVKDTHIDWGVGAGQVNPADFVDQDIGDITITTGAWAVEDESHAHTTTTISGIDISADTNLSGDTENILTGDALSIGAGITRDTEWNGLDFLVGTATAALSAEIVVGTTPGGELGGTWASPTIDDSVAVTSWNLTTPTITTSLITSTPTTLTAAELDRLDGLTSPIIDDDKIDTYAELNTIVADVTLTHNGLIDTSAEIAAIVGDEQGSGALVFATSPTLITPTIGTAAATSITIGINTLNTSEWANLDGLDQKINTTSVPQFARLGLGVAADATALMQFPASALVDTAGALTFDLDIDVSSGNIFSFTGGAVGELTASSGVQSFMAIENNVNQTGTAGFKTLSVNTTLTSVGSGSKRLLDFQTDSLSRVIIAYTGTSGVINVSGAAGYVSAAEIRASGDVGGEAGTVSMTDTVLGAAGGAVTINRNTAGTTTNAGWLKFYNGTTAYGMPMVLWTNL